MPTVGVKRDLLFTALGQVMTEDEFQNLCFEFGIELDDVTSEKQMKMNESGAATLKKEDNDDVNEEIIYKIDVPANRYDLLCLEGISRALRVFMQKENPPMFRTLSPITKQHVTVHASTASIRPFLVSAILRNIHFTQDRYDR